MVKALCGGGMNVIMVTHNPASAAEIIKECEGLPGKRAAISNENGAAAAWLACEEAGFVTGQFIRLCGRRTIG